MFVIESEFLLNGCREMRFVDVFVGVYKQQNIEFIILMLTGNENKIVSSDRNEKNVFS